MFIYLIQGRIPRLKNCCCEHKTFNAHLTKGKFFYGFSHLQLSVVIRFK